MSRARSKQREAGAFTSVITSTTVTPGFLTVCGAAASTPRPTQLAAAASQASSSGLFRARRPLPEAARDRDRQAMSQLAGEQHDLPAVMAFMRDEIRKNVPDVQR